MNARIALGALMFCAVATAPHLAMANTDLLASPQVSPSQVAVANVLAVNLGTASPGTSKFDGKAEVTKGFNLIRNGKQAQAVKLFDQVIAQGQEHLAGDSRRRLCRKDSTADDVALVSIDPAVCDAYFGKGYALIDLGRGDLAEADLRQAMMLAPTNAHFANEFAELFKSRRDWQHSFDNFAKAWEIVDKSTTGPDARVAGRALRGMGFNKAELGQLDEAQGYYQQSLQYEPNSTVARIELANISKRKIIGS